MAEDYTKYTREELIAMLQKRDAEPDDIAVLDTKLERLNSEKIQRLKRREELVSLGSLSEDEKADLIAAGQERIRNIDSKITEITALKAKIGG